ncbi:hypothetical protein U9M48_044794 [Paspalum notatum var. saurae]|uniref:Uncharacterized protein n=1 Tax=Paspalum notatum var. saurae TaxID=547442 RepID=A0AAQ3UXM8_PASNO
MVLMAGSSDHRATATAKPAPPAPSPSPSPAPAARTRLHGFSFPTLSWGSHRLLRCAKDGASASASPPPHPHTPSPEKEKPRGQQPAQPAAAPTRPPWNLRTRRSATFAPLAAGSDGAGKATAAADGGQAQQPLASPPAAPAKKGFSAALTKEEIAEDFAAIRGTRPPRRPKKRPRAVQRQLDLLYPGLSLADVNLDSYKIEEQ